MSFRYRTAKKSSWGGVCAKNIDIGHLMSRKRLYDLTGRISSSSHLWQDPTVDEMERYVQCSATSYSNLRDLRGAFCYHGLIFNLNDFSDPKIPCLEDYLLSSSPEYIQLN
ncbi:hypothetical protein AVEN_23216-1 [Araneus ventricosus]|uniref:Uncharacterized protein n=1 Tax=Araneus ventricosus TaxID=182803 RepID=A0A4Y2MA85_ARAVE|nr:hypothetical protein AVEN_23216-1 [Araneus ventricosus]